MHTLLILASLLSDPRNTENYHVLFDIESRGDSPVVDGYGAYVQLYNGGGKQWIRYCENFDGKGLSGRPNPKRSRTKLLPFETFDPTAYRCRDFTPAQMAEGQPLIQMGDRSFFAMKSKNWSTDVGGEILFQVAKKIPLLGTPVYRSLRIRATRSGPDFNYTVESIIPRTGVCPSHFFMFDVSGSGLGIPNGIDSIEINPGESTERKVDLDVLEGKIDINGDGKTSSKTNH